MFARGYSLYSRLDVESTIPKGMAVTLVLTMTAFILLLLQDIIYGQIHLRAIVLRGLTARIVGSATLLACVGGIVALLALLAN